MAVSENVLKREIFVNVCGVPFRYIEQISTDRIDGFMGRCDSKMSYITINADMTKEAKESTLIHEWLHATLDLQGMGDLSNNEQLISVLANELYRAGFKIRTGDKKAEGE